MLIARWSLPWPIASATGGSSSFPRVPCAASRSSCSKHRNSAQSPRYSFRTNSVLAPSLGVLRLIRKWETRRVAPDRVLLAAGDPVTARIPGSLAATPCLGLKAVAARSTRSRRPWVAQTRKYVWDRRRQRGRLKALSQSGELRIYRYVHLAVHGLPGIEDSRQPSLVFSLNANPSHEQARDGRWLSPPRRAPAIAHGEQPRRLQTHATADWGSSTRERASSASRKPRLQAGTRG